jgi:hypothetical protein
LRLSKRTTELYKLVQTAEQHPQGSNPTNLKAELTQVRVTAAAAADAATLTVPTERTWITQSKTVLLCRFVRLENFCGTVSRRVSSSRANVNNFVIISAQQVLV